MTNLTQRQPARQTPIDIALASLESVVGGYGGLYFARCPLHEDGKPALLFLEGEGGRIEIACHSGCSRKDLAGMLHLAPGILIEGTSPKNFAVAAYEYIDSQDQPGEGRVLKAAGPVATKGN